jgi:hypothetical protein
VYSAIKTAEFIKNQYPDAVVTINHDEQLHLNLSVSEH